MPFEIQWGEYSTLRVPKFKNVHISIIDLVIIQVCRNTSCVRNVVQVEYICFATVDTTFGNVTPNRPIVFNRYAFDI